MRILSLNEIRPYIAKLVDVARFGVSSDLLGDGSCGELLQAYLALSSGLLDEVLGSEDRFWNRYYWFKRFARVQHEKFGPDAGIDQQSFQILEYPDCDVDWATLEQVESAAASDSRRTP